MKKDFLSLIGCGWLGKSLAIELQRSNYEILATTTHDKSAEFESEGIPYIQLDVGMDLVPEKILQSDVLIYMVPPLATIQVKHFFDQIPADKKIIFISSTSVYGKTLGDVNEDTPHEVCSTGSPLLVETENYLRNRFKFATILRFGGLYGGKRHPVNFLQKKTGLSGGKAFLHLVDRKDCIQSIKATLNHKAFGETFNIVADVKMRKEDFYIFMAKKFNLTPPQYLDETISGKETKISNEKSKIKLGMTYLDPSEFCTSSE